MQMLHSQWWFDLDRSRKLISCHLSFLCMQHWTLLP